MAIDDIRNTKIEKIEKLRKAGTDPYPASSKRTNTVSDTIENFDKLAEEKKELVLTGRMMAKREHGGSMFFDLRDASGKFQGFIKQDIIGKNHFAQFSELIDIGDFIQIKGILFKTKKEEKTIEVSEFKLLSKSLLPLPEKWHGLQDVEERLRKRYLDLIMNPEVKQVFEKRSLILDSIR